MQDINIAAYLSPEVRHWAEHGVVRQISATIAREQELMKFIDDTGKYYGRKSRIPLLEEYYRFVCSERAITIKKIAELPKSHSDLLNKFGVIITALIRDDTRFGSPYNALHSSFDPSWSAKFNQTSAIDEFVKISEYTTKWFVKQYPYVPVDLLLHPEGLRALASWKSYHLDLLHWHNDILTVNMNYLVQIAAKYAALSLAHVRLLGYYPAIAKVLFADSGNLETFAQVPSHATWFLSDTPEKFKILPDGQLYIKAEKHRSNPGSEDKEYYIPLNYRPIESHRTWGSSHLNRRNEPYISSPTAYKAHGDDYVIPSIITIDSVTSLARLPHKKLVLTKQKIIINLVVFAVVIFIYIKLIKLGIGMIRGACRLGERLVVHLASKLGGKRIARTRENSGIIATDRIQENNADVQNQPLPQSQSHLLSHRQAPLPTENQPEIQR